MTTTDGYADTGAGDTARVWDVVVIGAGPAGSQAAHAASRAGAHTLLIEREQLPRYKRCGGGLTGAALAALPDGFDVPTLALIDSATFSTRLSRPRHRRADEPFLTLINRDTFDAQLMTAAQAAGARLITGVTVTAIAESDDLVELTTTAGTIRTRALVGADGSAGRTARVVGATYSQVDLGLEAEIRVNPATEALWDRRVHLDFGTVPGGYAWVFPKGNVLTVGVIGDRSQSAALRDYFSRYLQLHDLAGLPREHDGGHLTRTRAAGSPVAAGRALLAGDAAGLVDPWLREGISYALISGRLAGLTAADLGLGRISPGRAAHLYTTSVDRDLGAALDAAGRFHALFTRRPRIEAVITRTRLGWVAFQRISRGQSTLAGALALPLVSPLAKLLTGQPAT